MLVYSEVVDQVRYLLVEVSAVLVELSIPIQWSKSRCYVIDSFFSSAIPR